MSDLSQLKGKAVEEIVLWRMARDGVGKIAVQRIEKVNQTETESQLEEVLAQSPDLLMEDLTLIGRQTETPGGPLDLLGVDPDGQLVVFELKRGTLTREAVAQIIDYSSFLSDLNPDELSAHISERSGNFGMPEIESFSSWYQGQFGKTLDRQIPKMVLVGLGADDRTKRMVSFLSQGDIDISLVTFHGFKKDGETFLARQVEVESKPPPSTPSATKKGNLERLKKRIQDLGVESYYYEMASFCRAQLPAGYEWPNQTGFSYGLPELTESGGSSNRVYLALYLNDNHPGRIEFFFHERAIRAASNSFEDFLKQSNLKVRLRNDGNADFWVNNKADWESVKHLLERLLPEIVVGWKKKKEQQSQAEFDAVDETQGAADSG